MEEQKVGEFSFSYKKPERATYSLWVEDCAYILDKGAAQKFVDRMKENWPDLEYDADATKEEDYNENLKYYCDHIKHVAKKVRIALGKEPKEVKKSLTPFLEMGQWRTQNAYELINDLRRIRDEYEIDDKEFIINECHKLIDAIIEALKEKKR